MRLRSWSATALGLDCQHMDADDGAADTEVAELGLENETEALAFAEQVQQPLIMLVARSASHPGVD